MKITRNKVLELTDNGRMLFEAYLPELSIIGDRGEVNITSPFTKIPNSFSVFSSNKWMFKDYSQSGYYGDIFSFIAMLYKLDLKADFVKILAIIENKIKEMGCLADSQNDTTHFNNETNEMLILADTNFSRPQIETLFKTFHPLMDGTSVGFEIHLVKKFLKKDGKKDINYQFQWSKPKETFFAITVKEGLYYILYNPTTRKTYEWGGKQENYIIGWKEAIRIMYIDYIYYRKTLVLTNSITVMLNLQALSIPCIVFITEDNHLSPFFDIIIKPLFDKFLLMYDGIINHGYTVMYELHNGHDWVKLKPEFKKNGILIKNLEPWQYFRECGTTESAIEAIVDLIEHVDAEYEYLP